MGPRRPSLPPRRAAPIAGSGIDRGWGGGYPPAMRRPPPLRAGDVVRIIAPGSGFEPAAFEAGLRVLRDRLGFRPRFRDDITAREGYLAGDDRRRLAEWNEAVG